MVERRTVVLPSSLQYEYADVAVLEHEVDGLHRRRALERVHFVKLDGSDVDFELTISFEDGTAWKETVSFEKSDVFEEFQDVTGRWNLTALRAVRAVRTALNGLVAKYGAVTEIDVRLS